MKIAALLFVVGLCSLVRAQQAYTGIVADNFVSSHLASHNPSSIVDSKSKFAASTNFNYSTISNFYSRNYLMFGFGSKYIESKKPGYNNKYLSSDILNIKYELNHQNALAYSFRIRSLDNMKGLPTIWSHKTVLDYEENTINQQQSIAGFSMVQMNFTEHNFTYARTIFDHQTSFLKGGASFKILNGISSDYFYANAGNITFPDSTNSVSQLTGLEAEFGKNFSKNQLFYKNRGFGLDLGITFESRPEYEKQYYDMDGSKNNIRYDINKYKWKVTASLTDIGWVRYMNDTSEYHFSLPAITTQAKEIVDVNALISSPYKFIKDSLQSQGTKASDQPKKFRMNLPTAFHAGFDMNVRRDFYVSYNVSIPLGLQDDHTRISNFFIQTVTPRIEKTKWSVMFPLSHMGNGKLYAGCAGRIMYKQVSVFAGANNLSLLYGQKSSLSRNIFAGISYSVLYKVPGDRDRDKISDEKDDCPFDPGLPEYNGCPDTDGDGIIDKEDHCIYDKGGRATHGCPDTDGDGIVDLNDMCPEVKGLGIHYGCPDKDLDGVIDAADRCPDVPGVELNNGCPMENKGCCMDDDGDGVTNSLDRCPGVVGSVYNYGCPIDSTNINKIKLQTEKEKKDANNTAQQVKDNPTIEARKQLITSSEELKEILGKKDIIKDLNVYFDVDQATLTDKEQANFDKFVSSFPKTGNLAIILIGYTDQDGSLDYNLTLSKKRAETVKRKLVDFYGFNPDNIEVLYYGESKSIHKGSYTEEMKRQDRRVEIKLIKMPEKK